MKIPEIERQLIAQMSDIERGIIADADKKSAALKKAKAETPPDFSWWTYDDPNCYFCISTHEKYKFEPGQ